MQDGFRQTTFGTAVLLLATIGMGVVLFPFWKAIFWAVVLTILFWPLREKLMNWLNGRKTLTATIIVLMNLLFILFPALLILGIIAEGAVSVLSQVEFDSFPPGKMLETISGKFPRLSDALATLGIDFAAIKSVLGNMFAYIAQFLATHLAQIGQGASTLVFQGFLAFYVLFTFLLFGDRMYESCFAVIPASREHKQKFFTAFSEMAVATIRGMVSVGFVQALLGAIIFFFLGIDNAAFWGAIMGLLSVIPPFGAGFIWGPAGIAMVLSGDTVDGIILLAFGAGVISMSDNVVRPIVVGRASSVPSFLILVTTLGGLAVFGLTGLVLGPVIAAVFLSIWQLLYDEKKKAASSSIDDETLGTFSHKE
ncbi:MULTISPECIES: AI-2E family transporter [Halocynthiibacter]|uniref:AI-2E family transporter n=1 Tax=Halocynthiibacter halioticoli TaxID=2986804 RepID=A0AAE3IVZ5_9RHOB|nr:MULTISPECIES: AI-2E family transporter [Halocynthiibacter]MCV6822999.1 AI-2E family transporter [Halocynthiibacter halioticoli]MCW4056000.1 AI-2E family transporter [Halocynthiibacter sp. SDUM655004]